MNHKERLDKNSDQEVEVFIGGYYDNGTKHACYWKNLMLHDLKDNSNTSYVNSMTVYNNDVYCAGYSTLGGCYWKNDNEIHYLTGAFAKCSSIYIKADVIYIGGSDLIGATYKFCFWTIDHNGNIVQHPIIENIGTPTNPGSQGEKTGIFIDEYLNIYFAGTLGNGITSYYGFYWSSSNGLKLFGNDTQIHSIFVTNGIAYFGGATGSAGSYNVCYLKENKIFYPTTALTYSDGNYTTSIFVSNNGDVYIPSWSSYYVKNKTAYSAPVGTSSVLEFNNNVYIAGGIGNFAYCVINNTSNMKQLETNGATYTYAYTMFVQYKK